VRSGGLDRGDIADDRGGGLRAQKAGRDEVGGHANLERVHRLTRVRLKPLDDFEQRIEPVEHLADDRAGALVLVERDGVHDRRAPLGFGPLRIPTRDGEPPGEKGQQLCRAGLRILDALATALNGAFTTFQGTVNGALAALQGRTITGGGLVSGGGDLGDNRVLNVTAANQGEARTGTAVDRALTPASLGPMIKAMSEAGYCTIPAADPANTPLIQWGRFSAGPNGSTSVSFPISFTGNAFSVVVDGTSDTSNDAQDNYPAVRPGTISGTGFAVHNANATTDACCFIAIGRIDLS
jgi:hypothetical protein